MEFRPGLKACEPTSFAQNMSGRGAGARSGSALSQEDWEPQEVHGWGPARDVAVRRRPRVRRVRRSPSMHLTVIVRSLLVIFGFGRQTRRVAAALRKCRGLSMGYSAVRQALPSHRIVDAVGLCDMHGVAPRSGPECDVAGLARPIPGLDGRLSAPAGPGHRSLAGACRLGSSTRCCCWRRRWSLSASSSASRTPSSKVNCCRVRCRQRRSWRSHWRPTMPPATRPIGYVPVAGPRGGLGTAAAEPAERPLSVVISSMEEAI